MSNRTILIVDSDLSHISSLEDLLVLEGFSPVFASTLEKGINLTRDRKPSIILIGFDSPNTASVDLFKKIEITMPGATVIAMTNRSNSNGRKEALECGIQHFLRKPVNMPELLSQFRTISELRDLRHKYTAENQSTRMDAVATESNTLYKQILEELPDPVVILYKQKYLFANKSALEYLGYTWDELKAQSTQDIMHPDDIQMVKDRQALWDAGKIPPAVEERYIRKDGSIAIGEIHTRKIVFEGLDARVAVVRDTAERHENEKKLRQSEEQYRNLMESLPDPLIVSRNGQIKYINTAGIKFFGYSYQEIPTITTLDLIHPDDHQIILKRRALLDSGVVLHRIESRAIKKDGSIATTESQTLSIDFQDRDARLTIIRDVTEQRATAKALLEYQGQYRRLLDEIPEIISITKGDSIVYVNAAGLEFLGYQWSELRHLSRFEVVHPDDRHLLDDRRQQFYSTGSLLPVIEVRLIKHDGSVALTKFQVLQTVYEGQEARLSIIQDITAERENEESLKRSREQYRKLLDDLPDALGISVEGKILYMNATGLELFGYELDELKELNTLDLFHPKEHQLILERRKEFNSGRELPVVEELLLKKDGTLFPGEVHSIQVEFDGQQTRLSVIRDLTERDKRDAALRRSETDFRLLIERMPEPVVIHDEGSIRFVNRATLDLYGYSSAEQVLGTHLSGYLHPDDLRLIPSLKVTDDQPLVVEARGIKNDGTIIVVESKIYRTHFQNKEMEILLMRDTTLRNRLDSEAEAFREALEEQVVVRTQELQASERRLTEILNSSQDAIISINDKQEIIAFNRGAESIFEFTEKEAMGQSLDILIPDDTVVSHRNMVEEFSGNNIHYLDMRSRTGISGKRKSGKLFPIEASISKVDVLGESILTVFMRDVSEKKVIEEELRTSEEQLRQSQKMDAVGQLAGGIAHDFNNLLTAINGYSEWLLDELEPENPMYRDINEIKKAGERAARLTRQLLAFGRKQVLRPQLIDLNEVVLGMINLLRRLIGEHIAFNVDYGSDLQKVNADPGQIEQVIMNLVINARDAMPTGGRIDVIIANATNSSPTIAGVDGVPIGEYVMVSVLDTGCGIKAENLTHIFEPFYTTKEVSKGTGLGLSTVFGIVKQSGGEIIVESQPGEGSTFRVFLPTAVATEPAVLAEDRDTRSFEGQETILIVEDEESVRELLKRKLQSYGYTTLTATHGEEALLLLEHYGDQIKMVITDVIMPIMGGHQLVSQLSESRPDLPVLFISGYDEELVADRNLINLDTQFIQKPFHTKEVAQKIRTALDQPSTHS